MTNSPTRCGDSRLTDLAARYGLVAQATGRLECLVRALVEDPHAATAIRDPVRVIDDHVADSLVALELGPVRGAARVADLGSGAGLPGLPLAIALPRSWFVLLESAARKCRFLRRTAVACGVHNVDVLHTRAEEAVGHGGQFDLVTARALASPAVVAEYAAPLLRLGGTLVLWRGARDPEAEVEGLRAASALGLQVNEVRRVFPHAAARQRHLHVLAKVRETPARFPRRPGVAVKRPLGR